jgi:hypothetical protein
MSLPPTDDDITPFGAEALPGGLSEINAARRGEPRAAERVPPATRRTPLVGLIALVMHWLRQGGRRR